MDQPEIPGDLIASAGTLHFGPGVMKQVFNITVVNDVFYEADEAVLLQLIRPTTAEVLGGSLGAVPDLGPNWYATFTITDDGDAGFLSLTRATSMDD